MSSHAHGLLTLGCFMVMFGCAITGVLTREPYWIVPTCAWAGTSFIAVRTWE